MEKKLWSRLERIKEGATIVMVTHSPSDAQSAHRIINLFDGKVAIEQPNYHYAEA